MAALSARLKPGRLPWAIPLVALAVTGVLLAPLLTAPGASQAAGTVLWSASMEQGTLDDWYSPGTQANPGCCYGGGEYNSGTAQSAASTEQAHGGRYAVKATIGTPSSPQSGVRLFRWDEARRNRGAYYSGWFYFPSAFALTGAPSTGRFWNLFQFKAKTVDGRVDPLWGFYAQPDGTGGLKLSAGWGWGGSTAAGPSASDGVGGKSYDQSVASLPVGRWVHLEAYLYQSSGFDGQLAFWQDGQPLFDFRNVRTCYDNPTFNSWRCDNLWSLNNYSDGLSPDPATIYIDDAAIALTRLGPGDTSTPTPTSTPVPTSTREPQPANTPVSRVRVPIVLDQPNRARRHSR